MNLRNFHISTETMILTAEFSKLNEKNTDDGDLIDVVITTLAL